MPIISKQERKKNLLGLTKNNEDALFLWLLRAPHVLGILQIIKKLLQNFDHINRVHLLFSKRIWYQNMANRKNQTEV